MTDEELDQASYFAGLLLSDDELDDILEQPRGTSFRAVQNVDSPLGRAIRKGRLLTKAELHESILTTARRHSTPAQQVAVAMLQKVENQ